jgi:glycosyltransferase involved in cell wall biosynthesis
VRILHVNKFLYRRGGAEAYMLDVSALQSVKGHEVAFFAMSHPMNRSSRFESHFPDNVEFNPPPSSIKGRMRAAGRLLYSPAAKHGMERVLDEFRPDVVHLHNIYHQLSPSILRAVRQRHLPAVMTLHDYKLVCPTYLFLAHGEVCEACLGGHFYQAILKRCNEGSIAASSLNALELTVHTATKAYSPVNLFLAPSRFLLGKMTEGGVYPDRLRLLPNFVDASGISQKTQAGGGVVYAGRLSKEKGIDVLIEAAARLGISLDIAGDGPDRQLFEALAQRLDVDARFHGHLPKGRLHDLVRSAAVSVLPSRCHENQPLGVLESFCCGVPVVGTTLGGIPELVHPGKNGELVDPNDPASLAKSLEALLSDRDRAYRMGAAGRTMVQAEFSPQRHLERLDELYEEARRLVGTAKRTA